MNRADLPPAARIGDPLESVGTPALLLDLDAFERSLSRTQAAADATGIALRPHACAASSTPTSRRRPSIPACRTSAASTTTTWLRATILKAAR